MRHYKLHRLSSDIVQNHTFLRLFKQFQSSIIPPLLAGLVFVMAQSCTAVIPTENKEKQQEHTSGKEIEKQEGKLSPSEQHTEKRPESSQEGSRDERLEPSLDGGSTEKERVDSEPQPEEGTEEHSAEADAHPNCLNHPKYASPCQKGKGVCLTRGSWRCATDLVTLICNADEPDPNKATKEECNGLDDNCDGNIDENFPIKGHFCEVSALQGNCRQGKFVCVQGKVECKSKITPVTETCNHQDQDCDGMIDNIAPAPCYSGPTGSEGVGPCKAGTMVCENGRKKCAGELLPKAELCNGQDDNCNGKVDESWPKKGDTCTDRLGACTKTDVYTCKKDGLDLQCGTTPLTSEPELCDGKDNDCDGQIDESFPNKGKACTAGIGECQQNGIYICSSDNTTLLCSKSPLAPTAELCDNKDNDCDGKIDNMGTISCGLGVCQKTVQKCAQGKLNSCIPGTPQPKELCNTLDDNCDGKIDEGCPFCIPSILEPINPNHPKGILDFVLSRDGSLAITLSVNYTGFTDNTVRVWKTSTGQRIALFDFPQKPTGVGISPDNKSVLIGFPQGNVKQFDLSTLKKIKDFSPHSDSLTAFRFDPAGTKLAIATKDNQLVLWDVAKNSPIKKVPMVSAYRPELRFNPTGTRLFSLQPTTTETLLKDDTGKLLHTFSGLNGTLSHDTSHAATLRTVQSRWEVYVWDTTTGTKLTTLTLSIKPESLALSRDNTLLAIGFKGPELQIWNWKQKTKTSTITPPDKSVLPTYPSTNQFVIFGATNNEVYTQDYGPALSKWDLTNNTLRYALTSFRDFTPRLRYIPSENSLRLVGSAGNASNWDLTLGIAKQLFGHNYDKSLNGNIASSFTPSGEIFASGADQGGLKVWQIKTATLLHTIPGYKYSNLNVKFHPQGDLLGFADGDIQLWSIKTGKKIATFSQPNANYKRLLFDPSGQKLYGIGLDITTAWDIKTGKKLLDFKSVHFYLTAFRLSPTGDLLAIGTNTHVELWDTSTGKVIHRLKGEVDRFSRAGFSPRGTWFVTQESLQSQRYAHIWSVKTGKLHKSLPITTYLEGSAFDPNENMLFTHDQGNIIIWDVKSGTKLKEFNNISRGRTFEFVPGNKQLFIDSNTEVMRLRCP